METGCLILQILDEAGGQIAGLWPPGPTVGSWVVLDASVVNVAAPAIHTGLHASGAGLQLVIAGYVISYAVLLVTGARLGDLLGPRQMFLAGLAVFTLASLGCGLAGTTGALVALRFVRGAGAAAMIPQVLSLIQRTHHGGARARAMSAYAAVLAGGYVAGQVVGGLLVTANLFGAAWRPAFLINVPIGAVLLAAGWRKLPGGRPDARRGLDPAGVFTLSPAVLALVVPLVLGQPEHWPAWGWVSLAGSVVLFGCFALTQRRLARRGGSPLVPGRLLRQPGLGAGIGALFVIMTVYGGFLFALALHLQTGLGESPLRAGLTFAPAAVAFALISLNWPRLPGWCRPWLAMAGFAVLADQLGLVIGVATFGTLYLNLTGSLPAQAGRAAFAGLSAHAMLVTCLAVTAVAVAGGALALAHTRSAAREPAPAGAALARRQREAGAPPPVR